MVSPLNSVCPTCKSLIAANANFCGKCGARISKYSQDENWLTVNLRSYLAKIVIYIFVIMLTSLWTANVVYVFQSIRLFGVNGFQALVTWINNNNGLYAALLLGVPVVLLIWAFRIVAVNLKKKDM